MKKAFRARNYILVALAASIALSSCPLPYKYSPEGYPGSAGAVDPSTPKISASPIITYSESSGRSGTLTEGEAGTSSNTSISLSSQTVGAVIYYTTNGTTPDPRGTGTQKYSSAIDLSIPDPSAGSASKSMVITATAIGPNLNPSLITKATINLQYPQAAAPVFSVPSGPSKTDLSIAITSTTPGASIYYSIVDGNGPAPRPVPGQAGTYAYSDSITITGPASGTKTIAAIAVKDQLIASPTSSAAYSVTYDGCAAPVFYPIAGTYNNNLTVMLESTPFSHIWYTTNGSDPVVGASTDPLSALEVSVPGQQLTDGGNIYLRAIASAIGKANSQITQATYTFKAATPQSSHAGGTYNNSFTLDLASSTNGAKIYYVLDGGDPRTGAAYDEANPPIITSNVQLRAIAVKTDYKASDVLSADYNFKAATPTFDLAGGQYDYTPHVPIYTATMVEGTVIYFTDDGSDPSDSLTRILYNGAYPIQRNGWATTIRAVAICPGYTLSEVSEATYTIALPAPKPFVGTATTNSINVTVAAFPAGSGRYSLQLFRDVSLQVTNSETSIDLTDSYNMSPSVRHDYWTRVYYYDINVMVENNPIKVPGYTLNQDGSPQIVPVTVPGSYATPGGYLAGFAGGPENGAAFLNTANVALVQGGYIFIPYSYESSNADPGTVMILGFDCNNVSKKTFTLPGARYLYKTEIYLVGTAPRIIYTGQTDHEVLIDWDTMKF